MTMDLEGLDPMTRSRKLSIMNASKYTNVQQQARKNKEVIVIY
jgi:hypothetical protein